MQGPSPEPPPTAAGPATAPRDASILEVAGAVFSSFLGIRKGRAMHKDAVTIRPHQVIVVGVALAAIFVVMLILFVRFVIRMAGA
jgi:hypothetical protein